MIGLMNNELEGYGRKWLWPTLRYYPSICLKEWRKIMKILRIASLWAEI
jgi:hypothetical protein